MSWLIFKAMAILGFIFYRLGGIGGSWWNNTKMRDFGVPLCSIIAMMCLWVAVPWWIYVIYFGLSFGSMTTYWTKKDQEDVLWYNWVMTGFVYGLSALPIAIYTGKYLGFSLRCLFLAVFMPFSNFFQLKIWHDKTDGVEGSRGLVHILTLPLLLI